MDNLRHTIDSEDLQAKVGNELLLAVRLGFIKQRTSLHAWTKSYPCKFPNVRAAILGRWSGPKAIRVVADAILASGVDLDKIVSEEV